VGKPRGKARPRLKLFFPSLVARVLKSIVKGVLVGKSGGGPNPYTGTDPETLFYLREIPPD